MNQLERIVQVTGVLLPIHSHDCRLGTLSCSSVPCQKHVHALFSCIYRAHGHGTSTVVHKLSMQDTTAMK